MSKISIDFEKLAKLMAWQKNDDEDYKQLFARMGHTTDTLPHPIIIDVQAEGGIEEWSKQQNFKSQKELQNEIMKVFRITINAKQLSNSKTKDLFPSLRNFHSFVNRLDAGGKLAGEAEKIADVVWNDGLAQKRLKERTDKMFANEPDSKLYDEAVVKIKDIWGFSDKEIEAFRYFCMQTRHENHNPSMNKSIYLWAKAKQTGKTTIARTIIAILNGFNDISDSEECESTFARELQFNDHDLPKSALYNAVLLDEAMPKDSRKSYGAVKSMLTSSSCSFNPKFQSVRQLKANRFYLCTSNDDISDFIQDEEERRFISIKLETTPKQISFDKIFDIWKQFITNATPENDWQEWYNTFEHVKGRESVEVEYYKARIRSEGELHQMLISTTDTAITIGTFYKYLIVGKATIDERKAVKQAVIEVFGENTHRSKWSSSHIRDVVNKFKSNYDPFEEMQPSVKDKMLTKVNTKGGQDGKADRTNELPF